MTKWTLRIICRHCKKEGHIDEYVLSGNKKKTPANAMHIMLLFNKQIDNETTLLKKNLNKKENMMKKSTFRHTMQTNMKKTKLKTIVRGSWILELVTI